MSLIHQVTFSQLGDCLCFSLVADQIRSASCVVARPSCSSAPAPAIHLPCWSEPLCSARCVTVSPSVGRVKESESSCCRSSTVRVSALRALLSVATRRSAGTAKERSDHTRSSQRTLRRRGHEAGRRREAATKAAPLRTVEKTAHWMMRMLSMCTPGAAYLHCAKL